ncbi:MAG TPA: hypothetical protein ENH82_09780 [bacterium]|nr:hypothetical protein [bacterium]
MKRKIVLIICIFCSVGIIAGFQSKHEEKLRFIFIAPVKNEAFFNPVKKGMSDAAKMLQVKCTFTGTEDVDVKAQAEMVSQAVADGYDGIALDIIDPAAFDSVIREAIDKGVPVVSFNVDDSNTPNMRLSTVCQDMYEAGRSLSKAALEFIPSGSRILMTLHSKGISALDERLKGAQDVLKQNGITWKVVCTTNNPEKAVEVILDELKAEPEIKCILSTGLTDTEAAGKVIDRFFKGKGYVSAGFDISREILNLIKADVIKFTIDQQPYVQGFYPVVQLTHYCRYGIMPSSIDAGAVIIGKKNVDSVIELSTMGYR